MKYMNPFISVILMVTLLSLVFIENAISEDNTCYLKSETANLHVSEYNFLPAGTIGNVIWKGVIKEDQQILLKSKFGRIYYEYSINPKADSPVEMGFIQSCTEKETILLP